MKVWELLSQIALAVNHLHINNVIHRDIKPENIFVMEDGSVRLGDFGLLKDLTNQNYATVVGTKVYHAPEVFTQKRMTFESDIFAIGNIIFELLTGKHPFDAKTEQEIIQKIVRYDIAKLPLSISKEFGSVLSEMMNEDPSRRPPIKAILSLCPIKMYLQIQENKKMNEQINKQLSDKEANIQRLVVEKQNEKQEKEQQKRRADQAEQNSRRIEEEKEQQKRRADQAELQVRQLGIEKERIEEEKEQQKRRADQAEQNSRRMKQEKSIQQRRADQAELQVRQLGIEKERMKQVQEQLKRRTDQVQQRLQIVEEEKEQQEIRADQVELNSIRIEEEKEKEKEKDKDKDKLVKEKSIQLVSGSNRLFVGNLSFGTTAEQLGRLFESVGEVINATIVAFNGRSMGYGFVTMKDEQTALDALKQLDKKELNGKSINVEVARTIGEREPLPRRFPRYGDYSGGRRFGRFSPFGRRPRFGPAPDPNSQLSKTRVFLGCLPFSLTEEELKAAFDGYDIKKVTIAKSPATGRALGFGYIEFANEDEQKRVLREVNVVTLVGRQCHVEPAHERPKPISTPPPDDSPQ
ncbi:MAG: putative protein kinase,serine/threonine-protein kinase [Streblomastix strix]|uniref:Uncharacterized protein n=1 Tax=Streblomastix strix TaxID=222440 RepID=A0A5J4UHA6_9EUKA|nr:MAG: putative protein kinase,serine/threonine-protein kinase [Streblomastix strix]